MFKKFFLPALFLTLYFETFGQNGQYLVILQDGLCTNAGNYSFMPNPKIIVINPIGAITETSLTTSASIQDILDHTAQFNAVVSNIMNQGYTINPTNAMNTYIVTSSYASLLGVPDNPCSNGGSATQNHAVVSLIPCCTPP